MRYDSQNPVQNLLIASSTAPGPTLKVIDPKDRPKKSKSGSSAKGKKRAAANEVDDDEDEDEEDDTSEEEDTDEEEDEHDTSTKRVYHDLYGAPKVHRTAAFM